jgi:hypothetical protein
MSAHDIERLASRFEKLAESPEGPVHMLEEVTIVGDPNAPVPEKKQHGESPITPEGLQNPKWKAYLAYVEKNPSRARAAGLVELPGWGYVIPQDLPHIRARLNRGWKRAGGYGLVPPEWHNYLTRKKMI